MFFCLSNSFNALLLQQDKPCLTIENNLKQEYTDRHKSVEDKLIAIDFKQFPLRLEKFLLLFIILIRIWYIVDECNRNLATPTAKFVRMGLV
jgi:hypothetical protein